MFETYAPKLIRDSKDKPKLRNPRRNKRRLPNAAIFCALAVALTAYATVAFAADSDVVTFTDTNFKNALLAIPGIDADNNGELTKGEMKSIAAISFSGKSISDITGIQYATNATSIDLSNNTIRDISAFNDFTPSDPSSTTINLSQNYLDLLDGGDDKAVINTLTAKGCTVTSENQKAIPVSGVALNTESLSLKPTETATLTAAIDPSDAANQTVYWNTGNKNIATVTNGVVTAVAVGQTTITAICDDGGYSDSCTVTVTNPVTGVSLNENTAELCVGDTYTLTATISPADSPNKTVTWTSSNTDVATIENGKITALAAGTADITATTNDGDFTSTCKVSIIYGEITSNTYTISDGTIHFVPTGTSVTDFLTNISNDATHLALLQNGDAFTGSLIGTGMTLQLTVAGKMRDEKTIIVLGDADGDGQIGIADYTITRLDILGIHKISENIRTACDIDDNDCIDIADYTMLRLHILDIKTIYGHTPSLPAVSDSRIRAFLDIALAQEGEPYIWGDEGPSSFDCSGYVYYCLSQNGYSLWRGTANDYATRFTQWPKVSREDLQPGDLMFYWSDSIPGRIGHIGIYLGNGYHIHASSSYGCVIICRMEGWYSEKFAYGRRVYN